MQREETIERLYDMYRVDDTEFKDTTPEQVMQVLRDEGKFTFNDTEGIDIEMRYYADLEIATTQLYTLVEELADRGKQVIAVVLDYILKIDSAREHNNDERVRLVNASRELKAFAQYQDIPVITAMQMNREGNGVLDAAMRDSKEDAGKFIGNTFVGTAWGMMQECDFICFINIEKQQSTGKWYLSFRRTKIRGKRDPLSVDYFNHPFVNNNGIRLAPDVHLDKPLSIIALSTDLVSIDESQLESGEKVRPKVNSMGSKSKSPLLQSIDITAMGGHTNKIVA